MRFIGFFLSSCSVGIALAGLFVGRIEMVSLGVILFCIGLFILDLGKRK